MGKKTAKPTQKQQRTQNRREKRAERAEDKLLNAAAGGKISGNKPRKSDEEGYLSRQRDRAEGVNGGRLLLDEGSEEKVIRLLAMLGGGEGDGGEMTWSECLATLGVKEGEEQGGEEEEEEEQADEEREELDRDWGGEGREGGEGGGRGEEGAYELYTGDLDLEALLAGGGHDSSSDEGQRDRERVQDGACDYASSDEYQYEVGEEEEEEEEEGVGGDEREPSSEQGHGQGQGKGKEQDQGRGEQWTAQKRRWIVRKIIRDARRAGYYSKRSDGAAGGVRVRVMGGGSVGVKGSSRREERVGDGLAPTVRDDILSTALKEGLGERLQGYGAGGCASRSPHDAAFTPASHHNPEPTPTPTPNPTPTPASMPAPLPILAHRDVLLQAITDNACIIVSGDPGTIANPTSHSPNHEPNPSPYTTPSLYSVTPPTSRT